MVLRFTGWVPGVVQSCLMGGALWVGVYLSVWLPLFLLHSSGLPALPPAPSWRCLFRHLLRDLAWPSLGVAKCPTSGSAALCRLSFWVLVSQSPHPHQLHNTPVALNNLRAQEQSKEKEATNARSKVVKDLLHLARSWHIHVPPVGKDDKHRTDASCQARDILDERFPPGLWHCCKERYE